MKKLTNEEVEMIESYTSIMSAMWYTSNEKSNNMGIVSFKYDNNSGKDMVVDIIGIDRAVPLSDVLDIAQSVFKSEGYESAKIYCEHINEKEVVKFHIMFDTNMVDAIKYNL